MKEKAWKDRLKRLGFSLTAIVLGLVLALLVAEGVLRVTQTTPYHRNALNAFHVADPYLGWRGLAGFQGIFVREDFKAHITLDDRGYRKKASHIEPLSNARKVVFLGDSFAWGWGVSEGELFSDILQDMLGPRYNVINLGINTFGTVQERIQLEREVLPMRPDMVGLLMYSNDFEDNLNGREDTRPYCSQDESGRIVLKNYPITNPIGGGYRSFSRMSYALTYLRYYHGCFREYVDAIERRLKRRFRDRGEKTTRTRSGELEKKPHPFTEEEVAVFDSMLTEMKRLCEENGIRFFLVYVPTADNIADEVPEHDYVSVVEEVCRRRGVRWVNLIPSLKPQIRGTEGEPVYFHGDLHWTPLGHRLAAEALRDRIFKGTSVVWKEHQGPSHLIGVP
ncbi:MAG: GDSL-type esterase/lipase family protein [Desulfobacteraceae bacterium]|jgi:lysophospholipase L1-like esterase